ncbi:uncharacterized protein [Miscanthus floridulus]|uniref:uncharacterized protein n=1 Tax=Miscanthus floridulus TaxID=154761 RepID=UPI003457FFC1
MKVKLRARRLWNVVDKGTDNEEDDMSVLEAILAAVPTEYREPLGAKSSAKEAWEATAAMHVGSDRAKNATAQLLKQEYANLKFKDDEMVEDFSLCLQTLISKLKSHGVTIDEEEVVSKYLHSATATKDSGKLLLTEEEWAARRNSGKATSSSRGGDGKRCGKTSSEKKKQVDHNACRRCGKMGHWAWECPNRKQEKKVEAHLAQANDEDEATILMAMFCALHGIKVEEKEEATTVEGPGKALKTVNLDKPCAQVHLGCVGAD